MTNEELTTLARDCDALVEKCQAEGDTPEELLADLQRRIVATSRRDYAQRSTSSKRESPSWTTEIQEGEQRWLRRADTGENLPLSRQDTSNARLPGE